MTEFKAKLCCDHDWHPLGTVSSVGDEIRRTSSHDRDICLICDAICVREKGEIWYYSYPVDVDWEGKIDTYEQSW